MNTIAAISTPYGVGGIAVIRMSGDEAVAIASRLVGKPLTKPVQFCRVKDLDDLVVTVFHAPHSFTGEDQVEVACHGSLYLQQEILHRLLDLGAHTAKAGEFTQRAFLNGKLDLTEAEAVADLIASRSKAEKDLALSHLRGGVSSEIQSLRDQLLEFTSLIELELDFADHEDLQFADRSRLNDLCQRIESRLTALVASFRTGNAIKQGIPVAIVGAANAGKSTLLNALLGDERAIVSDIAGTTRDTVEDTLVIDGILFRLIDTAGLRETTDCVEQLGITRSLRAMEQAAVILQVIDSTAPVLSSFTLRDGQQLLRLYNKADLLSPSATREQDALYISAAKGDLADLRERLSQIAQTLLQPLTSGVCISSARHYEALKRALSALLTVRQGLQDGLGGELLTLDLHDCLNALGEITGQITSDEVLANIFSKFCIGK